MQYGGAIGPGQSHKAGVITDSTCDGGQAGLVKVDKGLRVVGVCKRGLVLPRSLHNESMHYVWTQGVTGYQMLGIATRSGA